MTPAEFIAQLNEFRRRYRRLFYVGGVAVLLDDLAIVALYLVRRRTINRYAPVCRTCGAKATWKLRSQILITGHCPRCHAAFFAIPSKLPIGTSVPPGGASDF